MGDRGKLNEAEPVKEKNGRWRRGWDGKREGRGVGD